MTHGAYVDVTAGETAQMVMKAVSRPERDERRHAREVCLTAHRLARHCGLSPSRLPDLHSSSWDAEAVAAEKEALLGRQWVVSNAVTNRHGAIPGCLVRDSRAREYAALAAPTARLGIRLTTRKRIASGAAALMLQPKASEVVIVTAAIAVTSDDPDVPNRPPLDPRVSRILFAIAYARWPREGAVGRDDAPEGAMITVLGGDEMASYASPESGTLFAAAQARAKDDTLAEIAPVLAWLRDGGLSDEADGLESAAGEL